jgi:hypothetical protein
MILFFTGTPGIGKTSLIDALAQRHPRIGHIQLDVIRAALGTTKTTSAPVEDAVNWRAYVAALDLARAWKAEPHWITIDSTGASRRFAYLRNALGDHPQLLIRLSSAYGYNLCRTKWGETYSHEQYQHLHGLICTIRPDIELLVDGKTASELAEELLAILPLA